MIKDVKIALKYLSKARNADERGIEFNLPFTAYKNLIRAKRCRYTGIMMTDATAGTAQATDKTIDRIDSAKGYVVGNVVACCHAANQLKAVWEDPENPLTLDHIDKITTVIRSV